MSMNFFLPVIGAIMGLGAIFGIVFYVFNALAYYSIAKNRGYNKPWLAWIPVAADYLKGAIADDIERRKGKISNFRIWMLILSIVVAFSGVAMGAVWSGITANAILSQGFDLLPRFFNGGGNFGGNFQGYLFDNSPVRAIMSITPLFSILINLASVAYAVVMYIVLYKTYQDYVPQYTTAFLLLSIFVSITQPFLVFSIRNKPAISIHGSPFTPPNWNWSQQQPPYGTTPPPYGQGYYAPPTAQGTPPQQPPVQQPPQDGDDQPKQ